MSQGGKFFLFFFVGCLLFFAPRAQVRAAYHFGQFRARPPIHIFGLAKKSPTGLSPEAIKNIYHLPKDGGQGTIAIIGAYKDSTIENDLNIFSQQFNLPACTIKNNCFEEHNLGAITKNSGWGLETSLDVEWAHAIAPQAKILLVEAKTPSGKNLLEALDYARQLADVVAVSMSWGGAEFSDEINLDNHFSSDHNISFFASSGDNGAGASWPAASPNVVAVGGSSLSIINGFFKKETSWAGSGGGISAYESEPNYQKNYSISRAGGHRAIPDVAYNADPASGFSVYKTTGKGKIGWYVLGGTSAGAPQWAAIHSLGLSAYNENFYNDKASENNTSYFKDITSGQNGDCGYFCTARKHYDYVTGLGTPLTVNF